MRAASLLAAISSGCGDDPTPRASPPIPTDSAVPGDAPHDTSVNFRTRWASQGHDTRGAGGNAIAIAAGGDVLVLGGFVGRVDFGGDSLHGTNERSAFLVRYAADGTLRSTTGLTSGRSVEPTGMAVDPSSGVTYVAGRFTGALETGGPACVASNYRDGFVVALEPSGKVRWARHLSLPGDAWNESAVFGVGADPAGGVVIGGMFKGTLDFGGGARLVGTTNPYYTQGFVAKLDSSGRHVWSKKFGTVAYANVVRVDAASNVILGGAFLGSANLGSGTVRSDGQGDFLLAKLDPTGAPLWVDAIPAPGNDAMWDGCLTPDGGVVVVGEKQDALDLGGGGLPGRDVGFVARFDADGKHVWSRAVGDLSGDACAQRSVASVHGVACAADGSAAITGVYAGAIQLADGAHEAEGGVLIETFATDGTPMWAKAMSDAVPTNLDGAIAAGTDGTLLVTGRFVGALDVGLGAPLTSDREDAFVIALAL